MRHCNYIITDLVNKKNDLLFFIRMQYRNNIITLEEKILKIHALKQMDGKELTAEFNALPDNFKHLNDKNLGCA